MPLIIPGNSSSAAGFTIDQSIRFNSNDSAYMYRNVDAPAFGNKYTMSFWAKFTNSDDYRRIITFRDKRGNGYPFGFLRLEKSDDSSAFQLTIFEYDTAISANYPIYVVSAMKFRDYAAWYHIVVSVDYTRPVADRCRLYVNGTQQTFSYNANSASSGTPQSQASGSGANYWQIGRLYVLSTYPGDYYLAEIHVVDGNAYGPEFFGETNNSGIWIPKEFEGSHGSGGFFIDGRDSSDLGDDESGNGNDFTTSGLASHDQVSDSPTNNFAVMNPLADYYANHTFRNGNLELLTSTTTNQYTYSINNIGMSSGKWYTELYVGSAVGTALTGISDRQSQGGTHYLGGQSYEYSYYSYNGKSINGGTQSTYGNTYTTGDIIGIAIDLDNSKLYFSKNGTFQNSGDPTSGSTGTGAVSITAVGSTQNGHYFFAVGDYSNAYSTNFFWNFGQEGTFAGNTTAGGNSDGNGVGNFKYSVPSGYLALCTKNLGI